jgi:hypothetical protein
MLKENHTLTEKLIEQKFQALDSMSQARNDLFNLVALPLSGIEGKLKFVNSENFDGESRISDEFTQETCRKIQDQVNQTRKALDQIFVAMQDARISLLDS